MVLPDLLKLKPKQLFNLFDQGELDKYSIGYLKEAGLYDPAIWGKSIGQGSDGALVWLPQDSTGRVPITEKNSDTMISVTEASVIARLRTLGFDLTSHQNHEKGPTLALEVAGGAGLAAEALLVAAPGAGKQTYLEKIHVSVLTGVGNATGRLSILDGSGGTALYECGANSKGPAIDLYCMCDLGTNNTAIYAEINEAGPTKFEDGAKVIVTPYYRVYEA